MERYALKVDLSAFFNNIYEKVMILADSQWGNVAKVEKRLRKMFNIDGDIGFKSEEGFYIPSEEPIEILKHVEVLVAFKKILTTEGSVQNMSNKARNKEASVKCVEPLETADFVAKKKRNRQMLNDISFTTSTPAVNLAKRLKSLDKIVPNSTSDSIVTGISEIGPNIPLENTTNGNMEKKTKSKTNAFSTAAREDTTNRNKKAHISMSASKNNDGSEPNSRAHIFYNESGEEVNPNPHSQPENHKKEIAFVCNLENSKLKTGRIFRIGAETQNGFENNTKRNEICEKSTPSNVISILENITLVKDVNMSIETAPLKSNEKESMKLSGTQKSPENTAIDESEVSESQLEELSEQRELTGSLISCDESAVIELNDSECESGSINNTRETTNILSQNASAEVNEYCVENILSKATNLIGIPCIADFVVFKIKLTNGKISDFFVGKCEYVNKRTKTLKIQLTDGLSQIALIPSKFACNVDESFDLKTLNIKIQDMLDPKIWRP